MRIEITEERIEVKLIQDATKMRMSATQYICYLIENVEIKEPKKIELTPTSPESKKIKIPKKSFVKNW